MGIWGVGPFDNDDAADMVAKLSTIIDKANAQADRRPLSLSLSLSRARRHYTDARAAAQFVLLARNTDILGGPALQPIVKLLARMRSDAGWLATWKQPAKIAAELEHELDNVMSLISLCKKCRKDRREMRDLRALGGGVRRSGASI